MACHFCLVLDRLQDGPRGSQEALRPPQERPKRLQEAPKSTPGGSKRASRDPKRCQELPKTPTRLFRSTWSGSRFRKNKKSESIRPQGFSQALGPAVVFGKMEKFKAWLQKASTTLQVAEIYESQRPCPNSQNEKRRAGGGDPPWGSQSAARPAGARAKACQITDSAVAEVAKLAKNLAIDLSIFVHIFFGGIFGPP